MRQPLSQQGWRQQQWRNQLFSWGYLLALAGSLWLALALLLGSWGTWLWLGLVLGLLWLPLQPGWVLRLHRAQALHYNQAPQLYWLLEQLCQRAELASIPRLYWLPSQEPNAFTLGQGRQTAIALSEGLLRRLNSRQLQGVLAHELAHVRQGDWRLLAWADGISRLLRGLSLLGQLGLILALPFWLLGQVQISWGGMLLLVLLPWLSTLLQLALSRTREFSADMEAARLSGDPEGLAQALEALHWQPGWWQRLLIPAKAEAGSAWLRTHPPTPERIKRLRALLPPPSRRPLWQDLPLAWRSPYTLPLRRWPPWL
ncbi:zinc metalloprotease HtpX [Balneatrix alpica]|uniref:Zinc metalloprotease HtpX n=1 Tax=Balneatrix alpica TaxID=75684 RepID=A0ABV5ZAT2_9GAMM|nr:zinc metalloprotease HtpX [Balneatrix alpica]